MQATDVLAPDISFTGQEWSDSTSSLIDSRKSQPDSLIEYWLGQVESIATTVSEKVDQLTREESDNFRKLLNQ